MIWYVLAIKNSCNSPKYVGQKYGKWGKIYFPNDYLGATVLFKDRECWMTEEDFCHLKMV